MRCIKCNKEMNVPPRFKDIICEDCALEIYIVGFNCKLCGYPMTEFDGWNNKITRWCCTNKNCSNYLDTKTFQKHKDEDEYWILN